MFSKNQLRNGGYLFNNKERLYHVQCFLCYNLVRKCVICIADLHMNIKMQKLKHLHIVIGIHINIDLMIYKSYHSGQRVTEEDMESYILYNWLIWRGF